MARNRKQLSNAFEGFSKENQVQKEKHNTQNEEVNESINQNNEYDKGNNKVVHTQETEQENVTVLSNTENVTKDVIQNSHALSVEQVKNDLLTMYQEKSKKETVEDTHIRTTFLFRKDLAKRLDKLAKNKRGFKTLMINKAIEALLDEMEK